MFKATASFSYDRYICGETSSLARALGIDLNNNGGRTNNAVRNYNDSKGLAEVMGGVALLNKGTAYTLDNGNLRTTTNKNLNRINPNNNLPSYLR